MVLVKMFFFNSKLNEFHGMKMKIAEGDSQGR